MHIYIKKYLISSAVVEKLLWPQNRVLFVVFALDRLYQGATADPGQSRQILPDFAAIITFPSQHLKLNIS